MATKFKWQQKLQWQLKVQFALKAKIAPNVTLAVLAHLTTIGGPWYFGRVLVPQRLINQSFYQEILLLQKFNDIGGKVLKPKKISLQPQKKKMRLFLVFIV